MTQPLCLVFALLPFLSATVAAQQRGITLNRPLAQPRVALVIGNSAYETARLKNPVNDARAIIDKQAEVEYEGVDVGFVLAQMGEAGIPTKIKGTARNYTTVLRDEQGQPILHLTVEYIGKEPRGAFKAAHDWRKINTDFYTVTWENLTEHPIEFVRGERTTDISMSRRTTQRQNAPGEWREVEVGSSIDMQKEFPGGPLFRSKEKRVWNNHFFFDLSHEANIFHKWYTVKYSGKEYRIDLYNVFQR